MTIFQEYPSQPVPLPAPDENLYGYNLVRRLAGNRMGTVLQLCTECGPHLFSHVVKYQSALCSVITSSGARSFSTTATKIWNSLLPVLRMCTSRDNSVVISRLAISSRSSKPLNSLFFAHHIQHCWLVCTFINYVYLLINIIKSYTRVHNKWKKMKKKHSLHSG